jgi:hypothetical protein
VYVSIDEAGEERLAPAVNDGGAGRLGRRRAPDLDDDAVLHQHAPVLEHATAIEDPDVLDHERRGLLEMNSGREAPAGNQGHDEPPRRL